jgi:hypothetical protein
MTTVTSAFGRSSRQFWPSFKKLENAGIGIAINSQNSIGRPPAKLLPNVLNPFEEEYPHYLEGR